MAKKEYTTINRGNENFLVIIGAVNGCRRQKEDNDNRCYANDLQKFSVAAVFFLVAVGRRLDVRTGWWS